MLLAVLFSGVLLVLVGAYESPGERFGVCSEWEVLCPDGKRCCPEGHLCGTDGHSCVKTAVVRCSEMAACPDKYTCCKNKSDRWTCCPLEQAVCCSDGIHCCPSNYKCDPQSTSCISGDAVMSWYPKLPAVFQIDSYHQDIQCDEHSSCHDGETCCRLSPSNWGCCPFTKGVCCSDMKHCCPSGYTCTREGQCMKTSSLRWFSWNKERARQLI